MKKSTVALIVGCFLLLALLLFGYYNVTRPRVLVLYSYGNELPWTQGLDKAVRDGLKALHRPILLRRHYMNLRDATSGQYTETAAASARRAIQDFQPHVLVVFDDQAAELTTPELLNDPGVKIVFASIDNTLAHHGFDKANNATGMLERLPAAALRDAVRHLGKRKPLRVACIGHERMLETDEAADLAAVDWAPDTLLPCEPIGSFEDWKAAVKRLESQADVLLVTGYRGLPRSADDDDIAPPAEVAAWTDDNSRMLTLAAKSTFVSDGGALAIAPSPNEHGHAAAQLVGRLLDGAAPRNIPVSTGKAFVVSINRERLKKRGFEMPPVYEAAARAGGSLQ